MAGRGAITQSDQAMEVYQIAQFLDFNILSQGCEDLIVEQLTVENLLSVLNWSSQVNFQTFQIVDPNFAKFFTF